MDRGTGRTAGPKKVIGIRTRDIHIRVPGGFCLPVSNTKSIYRLVLITHQSRGPVAGAIAGKRRSSILGPRSPLNQPWARRWVLALAIPAP